MAVISVAWCVIDSARFELVAADTIALMASCICASICVHNCWFNCRQCAATDRDDSAAASNFSCVIRLNSSRSSALGAGPAAAMRPVRWLMTSAEASIISVAWLASAVHSSMGSPLLAAVVGWICASAASGAERSLRRSVGVVMGSPCFRRSQAAILAQADLAK